MVMQTYSVTLNPALVKDCQAVYQDSGGKLSPLLNKLLEDWLLLQKKKKTFMDKYGMWVLGAGFISMAEVRFCSSEILLHLRCKVCQHQFDAVKIDGSYYCPACDEQSCEEVDIDDVSEDE